MPESLLLLHQGYFCKEWSSQVQQRCGYGWPLLEMHQSCFFVVWASCCCPLLGHSKSRGRCWAAIWFSHHPKPPGRPVHGGRWIGHRRTKWSVVCSAPHSQAAEEAMPHLYKQAWKRPTLVRRRLSRTNALLGRVIPRGGCRCRGWKCGVLQGHPPTPHSIGDQPSAPQVCCCQINWWDAVWRARIGVSIWGAERLHSVDGWALSGADVQAPWHSVLETVWLHCDEAQEVGCLRWLEDCSLVQDAGIQSQFSRPRWGGYEHCGTRQARSTLRLNAPGLGWLFAELLLQHPIRSQQAASGARGVMSASCEVTLGVSDTWAACPTLLRG